MSRKRKILDILGMILGVLLMIVNGMLVGLEYMYHVGNEFYMLTTMRSSLISFAFSMFLFLFGAFWSTEDRGISDDIADISFLKVSVPEGTM